MKYFVFFLDVVMNKISTKLFDHLKIGDDVRTTVMGVLNLSPESFYKSSVYENVSKIEHAAVLMVNNGAKILDIGARSTAPGSTSISVEEEIKRLIEPLETVSKIMPDKIVISVDTQYSKVATKAYEITQKYNNDLIVNDVSCFKTDPNLRDFVIKKDIPVILMASKEVPGDILTMEEIIAEFKSTLDDLLEKGYDRNKIILDPGIGHWIEEKTFEYDLKIIDELEKLRTLNLPILVAISRKSFLGTLLNKPKPEERLNGTLASTAIAVYKGVHIVRTHDVDEKLMEFIKTADAIRTQNLINVQSNKKK